MVLVFGGAGFVGSHVVKALRQEGVEHLVADNLSKGHLAAVAGSDFVHCDMTQPEAVRRVFDQNMVSSVMLFAAFTEVGESNRLPGKYFDNNVGGAMTLFTAMNEAGVGDLIFSSSASVYGEPDEVPIPEDHPKRPTSTYGATKRIVEEMVEWYGLNAVSLRYFNAAGSDVDGELGEDHTPESHLIPAAIDAGLGRREPLVVFGDDYPTQDGTCVRDYVHVEDLASAHLLALDSLREGETRHRAYNVGYGVGYSVRQVIDTVASVAGCEVPHTIGERRSGDPAKLVASNKKIIEELGWLPRHADLHKIVADACNWRIAHPNGYAD